MHVSDNYIRRASTLDCSYVFGDMCVLTTHVVIAGPDGGWWWTLNNLTMSKSFQLVGLERPVTSTSTHTTQTNWSCATKTNQSLWHILQSLSETNFIRSQFEKILWAWTTSSNNTSAGKTQWRVWHWSGHGYVMKIRSWIPRWDRSAR